MHSADHPATAIVAIQQSRQFVPRLSALRLWEFIPVKHGRTTMIPRKIEPSWYRTYWFDPPRPRTERPWWPAHAQTGDAPRLDPDLLAIVLLSAALAIGAVLITSLAPVPPADLLYFVT
jgi:hypothetical protein